MGLFGVEEREGVCDSVLCLQANNKNVLDIHLQYESKAICYVNRYHKLYENTSDFFIIDFTFFLLIFAFF